MGHRHAGFNAKARSKHKAGPGKKTAVAEKPTGRPSPPSATSALLVADSVEEMNALAEATRLAADAPVLPAVAPAPTRPMTVDDMPMSSTRRKRLQRYIDKKLKKEERGELMRQLSASSFESPLIRATKSISKAKASVREQLRTALLEERAGLPRSDASVRLVRECVVDDGEFPETTAGFGNDMPASGAMESISSISSVQDISTTTTGVTYTVGAALRKAVPPTAPIGSALKRKVIIDCQLVSGKSSKQRMAESSSSSSSSSSDGDLSDDNAVNNDTAETMTSVADEAQPSKETNGATKFATSAPVMAPVPAPPAVTPSAPSPPTPPTPPAFVLVNRTDAVQAARLLLPVVAEEQLIMETIHDNAVTILCGETGSGKSTQLPQMLFEAGYGKRDGSNPGKIGVTQPRRVAAVSVAQRVGHELGLQKEVSYQIRYDGTVNNETVIKFMTDGVLLKEISRDFLLNDYSVLLIDEAHERSLNTDILIGLLSRVVVLRDKLSKDKALLRQQASLAHIKEVKPLKLVIMSATLRVEDFTANKVLFPRPPPLVKISARQYPVSIHFNKRTPDDFISEAFKKVCKIHSRLPAGGILVFVTGQNDVTVLCRKLREKFATAKQAARLVEGNAAKAMEVQHETESQEASIVAQDDLEAMDGDERAIDADECTLSSDDEDFDDEWITMPGDADATEMDDGPLHVLPLYALLSTQQQMRIFEDPPAGARLCVIATNVAETSLTIPNIKYVVDCGKVKERKYDAGTGVSSFEVDWTSKASADQRAGRAGRTGPGHCYRLYSSAVFDNYFPRFSQPEIQRIPVDSVYLQMKSMNIDNIVNFPFPTQPDREQLAAAERLLIQLDALDPKSKRITDVGRQLCAFPVAPRLGKMMLVGARLGCLEQTMVLVATLSAGDPFISDVVHEDTEEMGDDEERAPDEKQRRKANLRSYGFIQKIFSDGTGSDLIKLMQAVIAHDRAESSEAFCQDNFLRLKTMIEIRKLRSQLVRSVRTLGLDPEFTPSTLLDPPTVEEMSRLRCVILSGFIDQVAVRKSTPNSKQATPYELLVSAVNNRSLTDEIFIHPTSCLHRITPPMVIFQELMRTSRTFMKGVTEMTNLEIMGEFGKNMCTFSKPLENPAPRYDAREDRLMCHVYPRFGDRSYELPMMEVEYPDGMERTRFLARLLLDGTLFTQLAPFVTSLISKPSLMTNPKIPVTQSKVLALVQPLREREIRNRAELMAAWKMTPRLLLNGYLQWVPSHLHADVTAVWPPKE